MGREPSKIIKISGKKYRVTPYDPNAEARRKAWGKRNMCSISTRVPIDVAKALKARCETMETTVYAWLQTTIAQLLQADAAVAASHMEWIKMRKQYGAMLTTAKRKRTSR